MTTRSSPDHMPHAAVSAGLIGTGAFAITLLAQSRLIPELDIVVVCDRTTDKAQRACLRAGWPSESLVVCDSAMAVTQAGRNKQCALVDVFDLLSTAPIDVLVECTGDPEAGAVHALTAIEAGCHVVMVNKETDVVVGPMLNRLAGQAGCVYTPVDGDQHGLLIRFVDWARTLGLSIVCAGKARNEEGIFENTETRISFGARRIDLSSADQPIWTRIGAGQGESIITRRMAGIEPAPRAEEPDLCEMAIVANAAGLEPDIPVLHTPLVRIAEIPEVLAPQTAGGLLRGSGRVEVVTCLRAAGDHGMGGGVFIVVACSDDPPWDLIKSKGFCQNAEGTCALLIRPYHLLGVETPLTIITAVRRKQSLYAASYRPRYDLTARAACDLAAGTRLTAAGSGGDQQLNALVTPAQSATDGHPVPLYMARGRRLKCDLAAGEVLRVDMLEKPQNSVLWSLRQQQDALFF